MKIIAIRGHHFAFSPTPPIANAINVLRRRQGLLIEVLTDEGITGWGETVASPHAAAGFLRGRLASLLLGQDPRATGRLFDRMTAVLGYDRRGAGMMAISAVDTALHDIAARAIGVPVADLLGGALRPNLLAYASGPFMREGADPYHAMAAETEVLQRRGYRAFKPRIGFTPKADGLAMNALRRQIGPEAGLMVDINQGYTARAAIESARRMAEADLLWIEEPVPPEDLRGYSTVSRAIDVAVAGGESLGSLAAFRECFEAEALSLVQPDVGVCGGFTGMRRVAALADAFEIPSMPHVWGGVVAFYASLQIGAVLTARRGGGPAPYPYIEVDVTPNPMLALLGEIAPEADGTIAVPTGPGLGFELSAERLAPWLTEQWTETLSA
ncbi:MAG TPA: mandelate racemase/muconate lactonizing enzyme family protein [Burkholderiaceae bacterium]|jgi:L-alanine-DL-glutamate epimerase-like enolase superfamily enzyme